MEADASINFAIIAKFILHGPSATLGSFQLPNGFIKSPPPLIFIPFLSHLLLSRSRAESPLSCPAFRPCTAVARLSNPLPELHLSPSRSRAESPLSCPAFRPCTAVARLSNPLPELHLSPSPASPEPLLPDPPPPEPQSLAVEPRFARAPAPSQSRPCARSCRALPSKSPWLR